MCVYDVAMESYVIPMPDADVRLIPSLGAIGSADGLLEELADTIAWRSEQITLWGKTYNQPRLIAWYGDPGCAYTYSGKRFEPLPWTARLLSLKAAVENAAGTGYNSVLMNYYRDHRDSMGMHSDDEPELGPAPSIASLSLGETRTLVFRHRLRRDLPSVRIALPSGSLLLMRGATQRYWKHGINKRSRPCGPRINLTFRHILDPAGDYCDAKGKSKSP